MKILSIEQSNSFESVSFSHCFDTFSALISPLPSSSSPVPCVPSSDSEKGKPHPTNNNFDLQFDNEDYLAPFSTPLPKEIEDFNLEEYLPAATRMEHFDLNEFIKQYPFEYPNLEIDCPHQVHFSALPASIRPTMNDESVGDARDQFSTESVSDDSSTVPASPPSLYDACLPTVLPPLDFELLSPTTLLSPSTFLPYLGNSSVEAVGRPLQPLLSSSHLGEFGSLSHPPSSSKKSPRPSSSSSIDSNPCSVVDLITEAAHQTVDFTAKELNLFLQKSSFSGVQIDELKKIRRRLKNRGYSKASRARRSNPCLDVEICSTPPPQPLTATPKSKKLPSKQAMTQNQAEIDDLEVAALKLETEELSRLRASVAASFLSSPPPPPQVLATF